MDIVFDLDGTLIDSVRDLAASASELVTSLGGRPLDTTEVAAMVGDGAALLVRRALGAAGLDPDTPGALARFLAIYETRLLDTTRPYPGVEQMLLLASRHNRLSVLTNKPLRHSRLVLDGLGLSRHFAAIVGGDGPAGKKPGVRGLLSIAADLSHVLLVGDSPVDRDTAQNAGCRFAWARYGFGARRFEAAPDTPYVLERPADLDAVLERLASFAGPH